MKNPTIEINGVIITLTEDQLKQIDEQRKVKEVKKLNRGECLSVNEKYYSINRDIHTGFIVFSNISGEETKEIYTFKTQEKAERECHIYRTMMAMRNWADFHNEIDGFVPDWVNKNKLKYGIEVAEKKYSASNCKFLNPFVFGISVSSIERAEEMLAEFQKDLEKIVW